MKSMTAEEARKSFGISLDVGIYEIRFGFNGAIFNQRINAYDIVFDKLGAFMISIIEDHYRDHGNGD